MPAGASRPHYRCGPVFHAKHTLFTLFALLAYHDHAHVVVRRVVWYARNRKAAGSADIDRRATPRTPEVLSLPAGFGPWLLHLVPH